MLDNNYYQLPAQEVQRINQNIDYNKSKEYWNQQEVSINGVLGGFGNLNELDIRDSNSFIQTLMKANLIKTNSVLELGAGIGRITDQLLAQHFKNIHIVEQNALYVQKAKEKLKNKHVTFTADACSLTEYKSSAKFDCIWIQWVIIYLKDEDLVHLLKELRLNNLEKDGVVVLKENISKVNYEYDEVDSSVNRSDSVIKDLFYAAGYQLIMEAYQKDFPRGLYPVKMYCFK